MINFDYRKNEKQYFFGGTYQEISSTIAG